MKTKYLAGVLTMAIAVPLLAAQSGAAGQGYVAKTQRGQLVQKIVEKWAPHVQEAYKMNAGGWAQDMGSVFTGVPVERLQKAASASTFEAMNNALLDSATGRTAKGISVKSLGDAAQELVYIPITPCRIFDTRLGGGIIAAGATRGIDVTAVSNYSFQGGAATDCNGLGAAGSFAAVAINFTSVQPAQGGYFTAYPLGGTQPLAATQVFAANDIRSNLSIVQLDQGASANEMNIYSEKALHLVGDVVGYFINPEATAVQCTTVQTSYSVPAGGSFNGGSPVCPATYNPTGGGCFSAVYAGRVVSTYPNGASHFCSWQNEGASAMNAVAMQTCCRVPGR